MSEELSTKERRELSNTITNAIGAWAEKTFSEADAPKITNYVRSLARNAVLKKGDSLIPLYRSREEAKITMEAAQDIMDVVDSIRWKREHGGD